MSIWLSSLEIILYEFYNLSTYMILNNSIKIMDY